MIYIGLIMRFELLSSIGEQNTNNTITLNEISQDIKNLKFDDWN